MLNEGFVIPEFDSEGGLPEGVHIASWAEVEARFGSNPHRRKLIEGLKKAARNLKTAGCTSLVLDGSFTTAKEIPADFDGCWSPVGVDPALLDPALLDFSYGRLQQKLKYYGELFPANAKEQNSGHVFLTFFQTSKDTGAKKGVIEIDLTLDIP